MGLSCSSCSNEILLALVTGYLLSLVIGYYLFRGCIFYLYHLNYLTLSKDNSGVLCILRSHCISWKKKKLHAWVRISPPGPWGNRLKCISISDNRASGTSTQARHTWAPTRPQCVVSDRAETRKQSPHSSLSITWKVFLGRFGLITVRCCEGASSVYPVVANEVVGLIWNQLLIIEIRIRVNQCFVWFLKL